MENLNEFELAIFDNLSLKYPEIKSHIPFLKVLDREFTGVGMYINFYYIETLGYAKLRVNDNESISTNSNISIEGLQYGLGYEVYITNGLIKFIELITYGEVWDGTFKKYKFDSPPR